MSFASMSLAVLAIGSGVASGLMACIVATMPFWFTFLVYRAGERISVASWTGVGVGILGACLLMFDKSLTATPKGAAMAFLSPVCWALGSFILRRSDLPPMAVSSSIQWLAGGLIGLTAASILEVNSVSEVWLDASLRSLVAWGYLVVFGTLLTYSAYLWLVRNVSAPLASSSAFVNPVVAVGVGVVLANEQFSALTFLAIALILFAVFLVLPKRQRA
jgi:drug/metabolite transporter (DMT)-like permease